jgi:hypothetical protein
MSVSRRNAPGGRAPSGPGRRDGCAGRARRPCWRTRLPEAVDLEQPAWRGIRRRSGCASPTRRRPCSPAPAASGSRCPGLHLRFLALRHVGVAADEPQRTAVGRVLHHGGARGDPGPGAVLAAQAHIGGEAGGRAVQAGAHRGLQAGRVVGVDQAHELLVAAGEIVVAVAQHFFPAPRVVLHAGAQVPVPHARAGRLQRDAPGVFGLRVGGGAGPVRWG